jgi:hypothetical protein
MTVMPGDSSRMACRTQARCRHCRKVRPVSAWNILLNVRVLTLSLAAHWLGNSWTLAAPAVAHPGQVGYVSLAATAALPGGSVPTIALAKRVLVGWRIPDWVHAVAYLILLGIILIAMIATMLA